MHCLFLKMNGLNYRTVVVYMNCPDEKESALTQKPARCVCVIKVGLLPHSFRLHTPDFIYLLTKPDPMLQHFPYFVTQLSVGMMINFLFLLFALNRIYGRNVKALIRKKWSMALNIY